jgi:hypothetical protein
MWRSVVVRANEVFSLHLLELMHHDACLADLQSFSVNFRFKFAHVSAGMVDSWLVASSRL